jgi:hypothetical protein
VGRCEPAVDAVSVVRGVGDEGAAAVLEVGVMSVWRHEAWCSSPPLYPGEGCRECGAGPGVVTPADRDRLAVIRDRLADAECSVEASIPSAQEWYAEDIRYLLQVLGVCTG